MPVSRTCPPSVCPPDLFGVSQARACVCEAKMGSGPPSPEPSLPVLAGFLDLQWGQLLRPFSILGVTAVGWGFVPSFPSALLRTLIMKQLLLPSVAPCPAPSLRILGFYTHSASHLPSHPLSRPHP